MIKLQVVAGKKFTFLCCRACAGGEQACALGGEGVGEGAAGACDESYASACNNWNEQLLRKYQQLQHVGASSILSHPTTH